MGRTALSDWIRLLSHRIVRKSGAIIRAHATRHDVTLESGTRLGPYQVLSLIGAGGMGEVYRAVDTRLGRTVAIKIVSDHWRHGPELRARFKIEAEAIAALA